MVWWLVKDCFSAMIRPLWLTAPSGGCVAVKFCTVVNYSERVFFCNDKTIMAYCSIWWVCGCEILHCCKLFVNIH